MVTKTSKRLVVIIILRGFFIKILLVNIFRIGFIQVFIVNGDL